MTPEHRAVVEAYAAAHELEFVPFAERPPYEGSPFGYGTLLGVTNVMRSTSGRAMEFGNFSTLHVVEGAEKPTEYVWDFGYLAIRLDRALPQIHLQAKGTSVLWDRSGTAFVADPSQKLKLEGDFNRYFNFYCPKGFETDALYIFTPDVMAMFIDEAAPFDAEIIDDWLFVYSRIPFAAGDTAVYDQLLRIFTLIGAKVAHQTDGYRDGRVGEFTANVVSAPGQRLRRKIPRRLILIIIGVAVGFGVLTAIFVGGFTIVTLVGMWFVWSLV